MDGACGMQGENKNAFWV